MQNSSFTRKEYNVKLIVSFFLTLSFLMGTIACTKSGFSTFDDVPEFSKESELTLSSLTSRSDASLCSPPDFKSDISCSPLKESADYKEISSTGRIRIGPNENLDYLVPTTNGQEIIIHYGANIKHLATNYTGLSLYFERPSTEYKFTSGGNGFTVTDSCNRSVSLSHQGNEVSYFFADGSFAVNLVKQSSGGPLFTFRKGNKYSSGGSLIALEPLDTVSDIESTLKMNLHPSNSTSRFADCSESDSRSQIPSDSGSITCKMTNQSSGSCSHLAGNVDYGIPANYKKGTAHFNVFVCSNGEVKSEYRGGCSPEQSIVPAYSWEFAGTIGCSATPSYSYGAWSVCNENSTQTRSAQCVNTSGTLLTKYLCKNSAGQTVNDSLCADQPIAPAAVQCTAECREKAEVSRPCSYEPAPSSIAQRACTPKPIEKMAEVIGGTSQDYNLNKPLQISDSTTLIHYSHNVSGYPDIIGVKKNASYVFLGHRGSSGNGGTNSNILLEGNSDDYLITRGTVENVLELTHKTCGTVVRYFIQATTGSGILPVNFRNCSAVITYSIGLKGIAWATIHGPNFPLSSVSAIGGCETNSASQAVEIHKRFFGW